MCVRSHAHRVEHDRRTLARVRMGQAGQAAVQLEEFRCRKSFIKAKIFGQKSDLLSHVGVTASNSQHKCITAGWTDETQQHFDGRAFPGTVWAEETKYLAAIDR